jgi:hypothetical protein
MNGQGAMPGLGRLRGRQTQARGRGGGVTYDAAGVAAFYRSMLDFFSATRLEQLPRAGRRTDVPQPIFILGAPRSGTTLIEQVLASHGAIRAGGERPWLGELRLVAQRILPAAGAFPDCLASTGAADQRHLATVLRDYYLARGGGGPAGRGARYFTDKMPFNEMFLPLLLIAFEAKLILMRRDARDVALDAVEPPLARIQLRLSYRRHRAPPRRHP